MSLDEPPGGACVIDVLSANAKYSPFPFATVSARRIFQGLFPKGYPRVLNICERCASIWPLLCSPLLHFMFAQSSIPRNDVPDYFKRDPSKPASPWPTPQDWLTKQDFVPTMPEVRAIAPNLAAWLLIEALCEDNPAANLLKGILPIIGNLSDEVCPGFTREQWFLKVAQLLHTKPAPPGSTFKAALEKCWRKIVTEIVTSNGTVRRLNPMAYAAFCAAKLRLWFDPRENSFYRYLPETGTWIFLTEVEVRRLLLEFALEGDIEEAKASLNLVGKILSHLKVIALYDQTLVPQRPVHLAASMLFLRDRRESPFSPAYFSKNRIPVRFDSKIIEARLI